MVQKYVEKILFNRWVAFFHDLLWVPAAIVTAYWFLFDYREIKVVYIDGFYCVICLAVPVYGLSFFAFGLYRGIWRFASIPDLIRILKSVFLGTLILTTVSVMVFHNKAVPYTVLVLSTLILIIGLAGPRLCYRFFKNRQILPNTKEKKRVLVVGAGQGGDLLIRDLSYNQEYHAVALVDDDPHKHGREIQGIKVYGAISELGRIIELLDIEIVMFAIPSAGRDTMKLVVDNCLDAGVECRTLPMINERSDGLVDVEALRPLTLEDLLGRETISLDQEAISEYLHKKVVLVTGAGGSIGSELCRQIAKLNPTQLLLLDNGEFNLYSIDNEMRQEFPDLNIVSVLGDVKNQYRVDWVFRKFHPYAVFHAAAYKHVPMVELNPAEGVQNNIIGTKIVANAAEQYKTERFVLVSTDKAVNPSNVMGVTKRAAELYCQNLASRSSTRFITTRFGNVLGSAGSVVPLFQQQIKKGGPVTVTHRDISRYFMTISEAVSLILQAGAMGEGGEIFVLDMGEPVLIKDLAEQMIKLSGKKPGKDIKIVYTGLRPGEKLFEEIFHESEGLKGTGHPKLLLAGSRQVDWQWLTKELAELEKASVNRNRQMIVEHLRNVVPEYSGMYESDKKASFDKPLFKVVGR